MSRLVVSRVVLYKHGVAFIERRATVEKDEVLSLSFRLTDAGDVLRSLTAVDEGGGQVAAVAYDSPAAPQSLLSGESVREGAAELLARLRGARVSVRPDGAAEAVTGVVAGVGPGAGARASVLTDGGELVSFDPAAAAVRVLDPGLRRELDDALDARLAARRAGERGFHVFTRGDGGRPVRVSYAVPAPPWRLTYRVYLGLGTEQPLMQIWAVVQNPLAEDWDGVRLTLISGLPLAAAYDLEGADGEARVVPPEEPPADADGGRTPAGGPPGTQLDSGWDVPRPPAAPPAEQFKFTVERLVTVKRGQSALVPVALRPFTGRPVLLYDRSLDPARVLRCVECENTTGLALWGGPVTVLEAGNYAGESVLDALRPGEARVLPYAVEPALRVATEAFSEESPLTRLAVVGGRVTEYARRVTRVTYTFENAGRGEHVLYLHHPRSSADAHLIDTPAPHEEAAGYWRFRIPLASTRTTFYGVSEVRDVPAEGRLADAAVLERLLDGTRLLPHEIQWPLRELCELIRRVGDVRARLRSLGRELRDYLREQQRVRRNLKSVGHSAGENEIRARLAQTLSTQEDRIEALERERRELKSELEATRSAVRERVRRIDFEVA